MGTGDFHQKGPGFTEEGKKRRRKKGEKKDLLERDFQRVAGKLRAELESEASRWMPARTMGWGWGFLPPLFKKNYY